MLSQLPSPGTLTAALWGRQCGIVRLQLCTWGNWGCIAGALTPSSRAGSGDCSVGLSNHILNAVDLQAKCCSLKSYCKSQANKGLLLSSSLLPMCKGVHLYLPEQSLIGLSVQPASDNLLRYSWALILSGKLCLFHFQHNHQWLQSLLGRGMDIWEGQLVTRVRGSAGSGRVEEWAAACHGAVEPFLFLPRSLQSLQARMEPKWAEVFCLHQVSLLSVSPLSDAPCTYWGLSLQKCHLPSQQPLMISPFIMMLFHHPGTQQPLSIVQTFLFRLISASFLCITQESDKPGYFQFPNTVHNSHLCLSACYPPPK